MLLAIDGRRSVIKWSTDFAVGQHKKISGTIKKKKRKKSVGKYENGRKSTKRAHTTRVITPKLIGGGRVSDYQTRLVNERACRTEIKSRHVFNPGQTMTIAMVRFDIVY